MTGEEETGIISRVLAGDADAFEPLVTANQSRVYNLALKMLSSPEDAWDVSQEAFLKAFRSLRSFRGESSFSSWLYRITANMCLDFIRKSKKRSAASTVYLDDDDTQRELELPDERYCPETELERRELHRAVNSALGELPQDMRSVLVLREVSGLTYAEISTMLGLETGTVKSRIFRARAKLAKVLEESGNFFEKHASKR